ncbi:RNA polymerase sigma factor [Alcaligenes faecalis]|uniref:RNA polymerase sigma factor n=1 Tax=Alcaligenes faecalis TaxID=511 RepID=UPI00122C2AA7|nr:sigma-70 family RNA polymerase sigma factor [Alcaligenes faecalis]KAA1288945.1 sigma-70 family RNA polymerase sigma factor [Alcaligenes faecalis]WHQ43791.1 sigma-70 family RNA polymerase sigma factor [Alcaligenes faecalis]
MMTPCLSQPDRLHTDDCDAPQYALMAYLVAHYEDLLRQMTIRLGCSERATDALHDTWLRLHENRQIGPVASPRSYLLRMAGNLAVDDWRAESGRGLVMPLEELDGHQMLSPSPSPEAHLTARSLLSALVYAIDLLPRQRRAIFVAARLEELSLSEVASRFGVSATKVRNELREAQLHCEQALMGNWSALRRCRHAPRHPPPTISTLTSAWRVEPVLQ